MDEQRAEGFAFAPGETTGNTDFPGSAASLFPISKGNAGNALFPASAGSLFPIAQGKAEAAGPTWLSNTSFSESLLPPAVVAAPDAEVLKGTDSGKDDLTEEELETKKSKQKRRSKDKEERHRKKHKKREAKQLADDTVIGTLKGSRSERKASADIWVADSSWQKDYYFDSRGDRDNLAFESLYRNDVARYYPLQSRALLDAGRLWKRRVGLLNPESDSSAHDESLKSGGRYWSLKVASLERRRDFKRLQIASHHSNKLQQDLCGSFVSLELDHSEVDGVQKPKEESWDDYVLNKTRMMNQMTHDQPQNESLWITFAKFQDEIVQAEKRKTMMQHAIDKKILLLERALEFHPNSEDLVLLYLETSKRRDDLAILLSKWERMIMKHSGSYRLWWQYLRLRRSTFSKFSVSAVRKLYSQALQALAAARNRLHKENEKSFNGDNTKLVEAERGIITVFLDLCRFEWQSGHHELAVGLLQALLEYNFFCPLLQLSQNNKLRLFEAFWNNGAPRIGESGAVGWSNWMQHEEEQIQSAKSMSGHKIEDDSSWSGWKETQAVVEKPQSTEPDLVEASMDVGDNEDNVDTEEEDDAALLEKLGLNLDLSKDLEVNDAQVWKRWSLEESQRDRSQWLPVKPSPSKMRAGSYTNEDPELEDEGLEKMVMFDDIRENVFSLTTDEARLNLLGQFLEFCNAPLFEWCSSNVHGYKEKYDSLEGLTSDIVAAFSAGQSWGGLLFPVDWIKECKGRAAFVRNTVLLLRDVFLHNLHFQEVLISLEAMEACERDDTTDGSSASRALAKKLLKASRQDLTLWAAYACFEASTGNVEVARKVFDTALTSLAALPKESQTDAPVLYLAYAEVEMAQCGITSQDFQRVLHILHFLGASEPYQPSPCTLSKPQVLKALRGYEDQLQKLFKLGSLTEKGASLVICAALFLQLTSGWEAVTAVFEQSLTLPGGLQNVHLERLLHCYIAMLENQKNLVKPAIIRRVVKQGIEQYPFNCKLLSSYRNCSLASETRRFVDELAQRNPSTALWLFALSCELSRPGASSRIHNVFERALEADGSQDSVLLWRLYIAHALKLNNPEGARRIFFRAIHACPWAKALWMDGFQKMSSILTVKELSDLVDVMREKELRIRTDVYEILLEEAA